MIFANNNDRNKFWKNVFPAVLDPSHPRHDKALAVYDKKVNEFFNSPQSEAIQAYTAKADFDERFRNATSEPYTSSLDMGWVPLFDNISLMTDAPSQYFEIPTAGNALTISKTPEGFEPKVQSVSGDSTQVKYEKYVLNLGWTDEIIKFPTKWNLAANAMFKVRTSHFDKKADVHYGLIDAAAAIEVVATNFTAYDTVGSTTLEKDINTINQAVYESGALLRNKGYGAIENQTVYLVCNATLKSRILAALRQVHTDGNGLAKQVDYNVVPIFTYLSSLTATPANTAYARLVVPGHTLATSTLDELEKKTTDKNTSLTYIDTYYSYYGAGIGDTRQVRETRFA